MDSQLTADQLLALMAPFGVTGLSIADEADPSTWVLDPPLNDETQAQALAALQAALQPPVVLDIPGPTVPAPLSVEDRLTALETRMAAVEAVRLVPGPMGG